MKKLTPVQKDFQRILRGATFEQLVEILKEEMAIACSDVGFKEDLERTDFTIPETHETILRRYKNKRRKK